MGFPYRLAFWLLIGGAAGVALGTAARDHGAWLALGLGLGAGIGGTLERRERDRRAPRTHRQV